MYKLYCDIYTRFDDPAFDDFNAIETFTNDALPMNWFSILSHPKDAMYLAFSFARHKYNFNAIETFTNDALPMNWFCNMSRPKDAMYLTISFARHKYLLYHHKLSSVKEFHLVTREAFKLGVDKMKQ